ncbi:MULTISPECIES: DUF6474 family protein [unclassified Crossiella]|uniref:DUF6474 family protein n=1 Tax=unclassified Crossiella TaxID=2620835 RepID=UPI00200044A9|nr:MULTISPECIES: DUF6474 family protein [unclassified Crossiella]MCK2245166.1 DUF6474 family protein [Crossiella sp. S99.2]MCK2258819.1 DUF6474 family protein [Crossiella sp. S99.1]
MARIRRGLPKLTPARAKHLIGIGKVVLPLLAPVALKAAAAARDGYDRMRARKLGIPVEHLATYSGRGGSLHARIAGIANALTELRVNASEEIVAFARDGESRLVELAAVVRAAERMPTPRRKAAHRAVSTELDRLESHLLHHLGV